MRRLLSIIILLSVIALAFYLFIIRSGTTIAAWYNGSWGYRKSFTLSRSSGTVTNYQMKLSVLRTADSSLASWQYRKKVIITGTADGAQSNYPMKLTINYGSGTDSTSTVYLGSKSQTDFDDLRFTNSSGTLLDYWIESKTDSSTATVWVELDYIPASPSTVNFYIYYGNSGASAASNGANTFSFFDHFDGASLDTDKWNTATQGTGSNVSVASSILTMTGAGGSYAGAGVVAKSALSSGNYAVESYLRWNLNPSEAGYWGLGAGLTDKRVQETTYYGYWLDMGYANLWTYHNPGIGWYGRLLSGYDDASVYGNSNSIPLWGSNWARVTAKINNTAKKTYGTFTYGGSTYTVDMSSAGTTALSALYPMVHFGYYSGYSAECDFIAVRKWTTTEPTWTTWESEEAVMYLGTNVKNDFSDLRFTTSNGTTLLDYWIESSTTASASAWIEFDSIGTTATTFYAYYGNSGASAVSNGQNTFTFFDDFDDASYDTATRWTTGGGTPTESGGVLTVDSSAEYAYSKNTYGVNYSLRYRANHPNTESNWVGFISAGSSPLAIFERYPTSVWSGRSYVSSSTDTSLDTGFLGGYQTYEISRDNGTSNLYSVNNSLKGTHTTNVTSSSLPITIYMAATASMPVDWILLRQYLNPEPTWGTYGSEEGAPTPTPTITPTPTPLPWLGSNWAYRKKITIAGTADGTQTNYQMKFILERSIDGSADAPNIGFISSHVLSNYNDLRFTKSDGTTLLDYWIERSDSSTATVWVEFDSISASPSTTTFYIYYGNVNASAASNGPNTFIFFDHFDSFDAGVWTVNTGNNRTVSSTVEVGYTTGARATIAHLMTFPTNYRLNYRAKSTGSTNELAIYHTPDGDFLNTTDRLIWYNYGSSSGLDHCIYAGEASRDNQAVPLVQNTYYNFRVTVADKSYAFKRYTDNTETLIAGSSYTDSSSRTPDSLGLHEYGDGTRSGTYDWIFVAKYTTNEPTWSTWGNEEGVPSINFEKVDMQGIDIR